jgi:hypothetical protein
MSSSRLFGRVLTMNRANSSAVGSRPVMSRKTRRTNTSSVQVPDGSTRSFFSLLWTCVST